MVAMTEEFRYHRYQERINELETEVLELTAERDALRHGYQGLQVVSGALGIALLFAIGFILMNVL